MEDNPIETEALALLLRAEGYSVIAAANGREALAHLAQGPAPGLIVLDMLMPVLDGWHFLEELKHWCPPITTPILVTTSTIISREWALAHGCAGFMRKPIEPDELVREIRHCLNPV